MLDDDFDPRDARTSLGSRVLERHVRDHIGQGMFRDLCLFCTLRLPDRVSIGQFMADLSPGEREIIALRFGLRYSTPRSLAWIGMRMGITRERVRQIEARGLFKLRRSVRVSASQTSDGASIVIDDNPAIADTNRLKAASIATGGIEADVTAEETTVTAQRDGRVVFGGMDIENRRVISDQGIIFVFPVDKSESVEVGIPAGVVRWANLLGIRRMPVGSLLLVKDGDHVRKGDELMGIFAEVHGRVGVSKKHLVLRSFMPVEYFLKGNMEFEMDEEKKAFALLSNMAGKVSIITYKPTSNEPVKRRRVIVKDERVYIIPDGAQLKHDNVFVRAGEDCTVGQKITGPISFVSEIDGTAKICKVALVDEIDVAGTGVTARDLVGRILGQDVVIASTGEVLGASGDAIGEEVASAIIAAREEIRRVQLRSQTPQDCIVIAGEKMQRRYLIPKGATLEVSDGEEIRAGDQLIQPFAPIEAQTGGKVNYITQRNKYTGEDVIRKIIVYSGCDYFLPVGIPLQVKNGDEVAVGEPLTKAVSCENLRKVEGGIQFTRMEVVTEKYILDQPTDVQVENHARVKLGQKLASIKSPVAGVVRVEREVDMSCSVRSVVERLVIQQDGEAHRVNEGSELLVNDGQLVKAGDTLSRCGRSPTRPTKSSNRS